MESVINVVQSLCAQHSNQFPFPDSLATAVRNSLSTCASNCDISSLLQHVALLRKEVQTIEDIIKRSAALTIYPTVILQHLQVQREILSITVDCVSSSIRSKQQEAQPKNPPHHTLLLTHLTPIKSYSWDQCAQFVSVYISNEVCPLRDLSQVVSNFTSNSVQVVIADSHIFRVHPTYGDIDPTLCVVKMNSSKDTLVIKLRKVKSGAEDDGMWKGLDDTEKKKKQRHQALVKENATTEELLRNMYLSGTDEEREGLMQAMHEGRKKQDIQKKM
eukprot:PhF_6_TR19017/c0_g2_i1/m.27887/K04507/CACYBP, SIP; calcyclin binding protein